MRSGLKGIEVKERWCKDPCKVKRAVEEYFGNIFCVKGSNNIRLDKIEFS